MDRIITNHQKLFENYGSIPGVYDELFNSQGEIHQEFRDAVEPLAKMSRSHYQSQQRLANTIFRRSGITFTVYSDQRGTEKIFPFDLIPRIIAAREWERMEKGLCQRLMALNAFLQDIYGKKNIIAAKLIPEELVYSSKGYLPILQNIKPPGGVYIHVAGIDLIKDQHGEFLVLEDNLRSPSGVSYVLENRCVMKRLFPDIFEKTRVRAVDEYPFRLYHALNSLNNKQKNNGRTVILTPGQYNAAYFEHSFLARKMGCDLVKGEDLFVENKRVYLKTTHGPKPVAVIYRRIDDEFLDPQVFNATSLLGVPGLMQAYAAGNVVIANAPGNGVSDDKAIYPYVPTMIRFYLNEEPILSQVPTYSLSIPKECDHVIKNIDKMVVKSVDLSGGYGMLMGAQATKKEQSDFVEKIKKNPRNYIAQPLIELSISPTFTGKEITPCRIDLRPYVVMGSKPWVLPGGLTRVALTKGSYVVNSSQGGGSKDTWVMEND